MTQLLKHIFIIFSILIFLLHTSCNQSSKNYTDLQNEQDTIQEHEISLLYGIVEDLYSIEQNTIARNKNLSDILTETGLTRQEIYTISQKLDTIFDVRKIRTGNSYTCFYSEEDSTKDLAYFVYEINALDFFVCDVRKRDSIIVYKDAKELKLIEKQAQGTIETSLWNAMVAEKVPPTLSLELSEIYAWTVDFFGLQKGDSFKVVFIEQFVDTTSIGIQEITYAVFSHMGEEIYAIPFMQDSIISFFDAEGQSLRKAFLKAPLRFSRISSHYSNARMHPVLRKVRAHHGVDYAAPVGTPVMSIGDGVVIKKGYNGGAGHMVKIKHNSTYSTAYLHLSKYGKNIAVGTRVKQGQIIGYVGSTGLSTGPHLDFRVYKNGSPMNPLTLKSPPVAPVKKEDMPQFIKVRDSIVNILQNIQ